jgi:hypothetical protein
MGDLNLFQARYRALRQRIIDDGIAYNVPFHSKDLSCIIERLCNEGTSFVKVTLPLLGKALDSALVHGTFSCPSGFKLKRDSRLPNLCYSVFRTVFGDDGALICEPNLNSIFYLRQFLLLDAKLVFEPTPTMCDTAVDEFKDRMHSLRSVRIPTDNPVLMRARWLLTQTLRDLDLVNIIPGHGPGSVAERLNRFERWDFKTWPVKAERYYPYYKYGVHSLRAIIESSKNFRYSRKTVTRCCLVPKDFKGPRLISSEHTVNQYLQQGQMKALMKYIRNHSLLSKSIKLQDQSYNQRLAQESFDRDLVTVDLSAASDTVSVTLVWYLLSGVPDIRRRLMATRSDFMAYKDHEIKITSFAPMGSATCFPIETLIFWAISLASISLVRNHNGKSSQTYHSPSELSRDLGVFGDDIILPSDCLDTLISTLTLVGCSVNRSKTCFQTPFRESCGSEWFSGHDVSIIRNRMYGYSHDKKFIDYPVLLALQRKFFLRGMTRTAALLEQWAIEIWPVTRLSVTDLYSPKKTVNCSLIYDYMSGRRSFRNEQDNKFLYDRETAMGFISHGLTFFERQDLASDAFPCSLGFDHQSFGNPRFRYNEAYQRYEVRVPMEFQRHMNWSQGGYPRLMARLLSDKIERIAIRNRKVKMTWAYIPSIVAFTA